MRDIDLLDGSQSLLGNLTSKIAMQLDAQAEILRAIHIAGPGLTEKHELLHRGQCALVLLESLILSRFVLEKGI